MKRTPHWVIELPVYVGLGMVAFAIAYSIATTCFGAHP